MLHSCRLRPYSKTLEYARKAWQGQKHSSLLLWTFVNYVLNKIIFCTGSIVIKLLAIILYFVLNKLARLVSNNFILFSGKHGRSPESPLGWGLTSIKLCFSQSNTLAYSCPIVNYSPRELYSIDDSAQCKNFSLP